MEGDTTRCFRRRPMRLPGFCLLGFNPVLLARHHAFSIDHGMKLPRFSLLRTAVDERKSFPASFAINHRGNNTLLTLSNWVFSFISFMNLVFRVASSLMFRPLKCASSCETVMPVAGTTARISAAVGSGTASTGLGDTGEKVLADIAGPRDWRNGRKGRGS